MRGSNQRGVRAFNERLILTLIRRSGPLAKADIAKLTGLSAQTTSIIMRNLEEEGLIRREASVRGKVGQPLVPFSLAADGAFYLGLKIGRRSSELVLIDFVGGVRQSRSALYRYPTPDEVMDFAVAAIDHVLGSLEDGARRRVAGLGIATPFELWNWPDMIGLPRDAMATWRDRNLRTELAERCGFDVLLENDCNAACSAELVLGAGPLPRNFLYIYMGYFVGGGLVLDGRLHTGSTGNAGALASMPVALRTGRRRQAIDPASIATLERRLDETGRTALLTDAAPWDAPAALLEDWIDGAADALAQCAITATALCDLEAVVVDGWLPGDIRGRLLDRLAACIEKEDASGTRRPSVIGGSFGSKARSIGAAAVLLAHRHMVNHGGRST